MNTLVPLWKTAFSLAILAIWLPATLHCKLENLPGLSFLVCCSHEDTQPHQEDDCDTDGCAWVESALYKTPDNAPLVAPLVLALSAFVAVPTHQETAAPESSFRLNLVPPELPQSWHFSRRAALPPRAPTFVS